MKQQQQQKQQLHSISRIVSLFISPATFSYAYLLTGPEVSTNFTVACKEPLSSLGLM
jgi:hypothetical protein